MFAICAGKRQNRPSAKNVQSGFASRRSPGRNTKSKATRGRIGRKLVSPGKYFDDWTVSTDLQNTAVLEANKSVSNIRLTVVSQSDANADCAMF